jgi:ElaB/YqjD/DUF883 family membrane-anchored ribosome-binding protein
MKKTTAKQVKKVVKNDLLSHLEDIKDALAETTDGVKSHAHEMINDLLDNLQEKRANYQECLEEYISDKPLKSFGLAVLFGIVVSKILL